MTAISAQATAVSTGSTGPARAVSDVALIGLLALAVAMPFEQLQPVLTLPWQKITSLELTLLAAAAAWVGALAWHRTVPSWRTPLTAPWLAVLAALLVAALVAPAHRADALKVVARLASGFVIYLMAVSGITTARRMSLLVTATVVTGAVVAAIAVLEYRGVPVILGWLNQYRDGVRVVGGQVRSGATLQYPTIAAMYFEIVLALGAGLLLYIWDKGQAQIGLSRRRAAGAWLRIALLTAALIVIGEGLSLTFTRAGLMGAGAALAAIAFWRVVRRGIDSGLWLITSLAAVVLVLPLLSWSGEAVRLRFSSEGRQGWYRADFNAAKAMTMSTGEDTFIEVGVTNTGRVTWQPGAESPFRASYHWLDADTDRVVQYDGARTELPGDIGPGASAMLAMQVRAPEKPGRYRLAWDLVQEHRLWFSTESGASLAWTTVTVVPGSAPARPLAVGRGPRVVPPQVVVLGRLTLWRAALGLAAAHPLFGVGPDNFRLSYGPYVGQANPDPRVHSNSMYLEWLTSAGLVGLLVFCWLLWRAEYVIRHARVSLPARAASLYAGVAGAGVAVLAHGVLDSFLTFTPTYVAITLTLGLLAAPSTWTEAPHAHRI